MIPNGSENERYVQTETSAHRGAISVVKKNPKFDQVFVTGSNDGTVVVWKFSNGDHKEDFDLKLLSDEDKLKEIESVKPILAPTID